MPSGASAPTDGWSGSVAAGGAFDDYATDSCGAGGALVAALGDESEHTGGIDRVTWSFGTPPSASIIGARLWRAGDTAGGGMTNATYRFWLATSSFGNYFEKCAHTEPCLELGDQNNPLGATNRVDVPTSHLGSNLLVSASCEGDGSRSCAANIGDPNGYAAVVYIYAADLTLEQSAGPNATDPGAGVYEALFSVDGRIVQRTVVNENGGRCRDVGQTADGLPAFLYVQPCQAAASADIPFDTTAAPNGSHHLVVSVIDAAGNSAPVLDRSVTIANPPPPGVPGPPNGTNASDRPRLEASWKSKRSATLTSRFGRAQTITGSLRAPGGAPISGATIDVGATPSYTSARPVAMASAHTDVNGHFSVRVRAGSSSRTLRMAYRAHIGDALPAATRTLTLKVRAGIALRVSPRAASVGSDISFRGRLRGGPIPRGGKQLVLEARSPGSAWIEFKVVRTDARGRFRAGYRFKFPGPADYRFRVRSEPEADYPFAGGASNVVGVHER